jgi:hypothetical protein
VLKSVDSKSLLVQSTLFPAHPIPIHVTGLIDSGCSARAFADRNLVNLRGIKTTPTPKARSLLLANGEVADSITEYFIAPVSIGAHDELCLFFVTSLSPDTPVIFGLPWLQRHNPVIDWSHMSLTFTSTYCQAHCNRPGLSPSAPTIPDPPGRSMTSRSQANRARSAPRPWHIGRHMWKMPPMRTSRELTTITVHLNYTSNRVSRLAGTTTAHAHHRTWGIQKDAHR